ncbi:calcium/sodium antiporter [archaeon]|jgi:cation:H+ antiporter|nr:calcium/sodium antiporter [archaeon]MBT3730664.1 calcium/sodium antiporter [archaeon]MBT4669566.1 calcium/sodium antiporter [archaeon]MBT5030323.1 calcium/sodium antiporter [archaeon]MBT5288384.1 calcium/sodium antiporter [archaeon]
MIYIELLILVISLAFLIKGSNIFIDNIIKLAKLVNISNFIIGLTVVAIGTSLPELSSAIAAAFLNNTDIIIGNVAGSNIANIALVLGVATFFAALAIEKAVFEREGIFLLVITILLFVMSLNGLISRAEGSILFSIFILYILYLYHSPLFAESTEQNLLRRYLNFGKLVTIHTLRNIKTGLDYTTYLNLIRKEKRASIYAYLKLIPLIGISLAIIIYSSKYTISSAINIATLLSIKTEIIGITLLAIGTSLPELAIIITAAKKRKGNLIIGTILGSNIYNLLIVLGISSMIVPISITAISLYYLIPVLLLITAFFLWFVRTSWVLKKPEGILLLLVYILFLFGLSFWILL